MATNVKGVFAGGDVVLGPSAVIDAIAHGRTAALAIDRYLTTGKLTGPAPDFKSRRDFFGALPEWTFENVERNKRCAMPEREPSARVHDFVPGGNGARRASHEDRGCALHGVRLQIGIRVRSQTLCRRIRSRYCADFPAKSAGIVSTAAIR